MTRTPLRALATLAAFALVLSPAARADGPDWWLDIGEPGESGQDGRVTLSYQYVLTDGGVDGEGNPTPGVETNTHSLTVGLDWRLAGAWWLHVQLPYVMKRSLGDPGLHDPARLFEPRDGEFLDDGDYHGHFQDWQLGISYTGHWRGWDVRPHAVLTVPSNNYPFFASAAPGQRLTRLRIGADASHRLGASNFHITGGYSYEFVEEVMGQDLDKHHFRGALHWDATPTWSFSVFADGRQGEGIESADLRGQLFTETWYHHDQMLEHNYVFAGLGAAWTFADRWTVSGSAAWPVQNESMHRLRHAWDIALSRSF